MLKDRKFIPSFEFANFLLLLSESNLDWNSEDAF